tara:strand:+ start:1520 stop:3286 length:1767 start_codon:yes stop_codon:yes gene_type:complete
MSTSPRTPRTFFPADLTPLIVSGWQTNKFDGSIPFWADVDGIQFTESGIRRRPGHSLLFRPLNGATYKSVRGITSIQEYNTKVIYAGDLDKIYRYKASDPAATNGTVVGSGYNLIENSGETIWDSGASTWDDGDTTWDAGVNEPSLWSFTNFGTWVIAANDINPLQIKKNNQTFAPLVNNGVSGVSVSAGGSGYTVNDVISFTGGLAAIVTEVNSGAVVAVSLTAYGAGYTNNQVVAGSGGTGTGFQLLLTVSNCPFTRVKAVDKSGPHILAINYDKGSVSGKFDVAWCDEDDPDQWDPFASGSAAGSLTLREASSPLKCIVPLGENKAIYTDDQMFILSYLGSPFYFGYQTAMTSGVGAVSSKSVVSVDRINYGLSRRGFFETDGNSVKRIGDSEGINRYVIANVSEGEYSKVIAYHNKEHNEVIWSLPLQANVNNLEISYNYSTGVFSKRSVSTTAAEESGVFHHPITADATSRIYFEDGSSSPHVTTATTKAHDLEDPYAIKEITSIRVGKVGEGNPKVSVGWASSINDEPTFYESDSFYVDAKYKEYNVRTSGRYLFLKIESSGSADTWEISNIVIKGRLRGFR